MRVVLIGSFHPPFNFDVFTIAASRCVVRKVL